MTRHRIASYTVESQRYCNYQDGFDVYIPPRIKDIINTNEIVSNAWNDTMAMIRTCYNELIDEGIPKEEARYLLPNACMCNLVFTMNLRSLINFWQLRLDKHAQYEIRELAQGMLELVLETIPNLKGVITQSIVKEE